MCFKSQCPTCRLSTWKGCGGHIQSVVTYIPEEERCHCLHADGVVKDFPPRAGEGIANPAFKDADAKRSLEKQAQGFTFGCREKAAILGLTVAASLYWVFYG